MRRGGREKGEGVGRGRGGVWEVPFMLMLSPSFASERMAAQSVMVREVPPPPLVLSSCFSRTETAGQLGC